MLTINGIPQWVSSRDVDKRQADFILFQLYKATPQYRPKTSDLNETVQAINRKLDTTSTYDKYKKEQVEKLFQSVTEELLDESHFDWIKVDERCTYWAWSYIAIDQSHALPFLGMPNPPNLAHFYRARGLNPTPTSHKERLSEIISFFDRSGLSNQEQLNQLEELKQTWLKIFQDPKPFRWLSAKNEEQCSWAWGYFFNYNQGNTISSPPIYGFMPNCTKEQYLALYAAFDVWYAPPEIKKFFLVNINKAWHQKKHRDARKGKKSCSFVLELSTKDKLDKLAKRDKLKLNEMVEKLILEEYDRVTLLG